MAYIALFLPRFSKYGGVEGFGFRLASALASQGHRVEFVCSRQETPPPGNVTVRVVGRPPGSRALKMLWFAWRVERLRPQYDLTIGLGKTLHQDILRIGGGPLRSFWRLSGRAWPNGLPRTWKTLRRHAAPANLLTLAMEQRQLLSARRIVAVSHAVKQWILDSHPVVSPDKIDVIYNEPDLSRFSPKRKDAEEDAAAPPLRQILGCGQAILIGTAGTNFRLKGVEPLVRSLALLPERFHLAVAGGRRVYRYHSLAQRLGVAGRVHFLGKVHDMPNFYRALDVFALPSFYDACANAVLEAVACGVPVVSSAANGSSVVLPARHVLQDPCDIPALAQAISDAASTPAPQNTGWPGGTKRGLTPYLEMVEELLNR